MCHLIIVEGGEANDLLAVPCDGVGGAKVRIQSELVKDLSCLCRFMGIPKKEGPQFLEKDQVPHPKILCWGSDEGGKKEKRKR